MAAIRVGLIGLSTSESVSNWAAIAHLPYLKQTDKFLITALCNSSVEKAEAAIKQYELPQSTKAYGSPDHLANDKDIDLVVVVTDVAMHYELLMPAVKAGKNCYTELPIALNIDDIRRLAKTAKEHKIRTMIGMQGQANPLLNTVKKTIEEGKIGKVLSSTVTGYAGLFGGQPVPQKYERLFERGRSTNIVTVWFLHSFNNVQHVLGDLESFSSILDIKQPKIDFFDPSAVEKGTTDTRISTNPDHVSLQGKLVSGALLTYHMEGGEPFPGEPGIRWHIVGDKGSLMITSPMFLFDIVTAGTKVMLYEKGEPKLGASTSHASPPEAVELEIPKDALTDLQGPAQNVGRLYEAYADGKTDMYADWDLGLKRHELIEEMFQRWDGDQPFGLKAAYLNKV